MGSTIVHWDPLCLEPARDFAARVRLITSTNDLATLLDDCVRALGFQYFALVSHADLSSGDDGVIHIDTYPSAWAGRYIEGKFFLRDPIVEASLRTHLGFAWDEMTRLITVTAGHRKILELARKEGVGEGFTVPANVPGFIHGSCSFAVPEGHSLPKSALYAAQLVGGFAYHAARTLTGSAAPTSPPPRLTSRQRECVVLAACGKSDWVIGRILALRKDTVTKYLVDARDRFGVATRVQLVAAALYAGAISFLEICR